jgi:hypothetical protein
MKRSRFRLLVMLAVVFALDACHETSAQETLMAEGASAPQKEKLILTQNLCTGIGTFYVAFVTNGTPAVFRGVRNVGGCAIRLECRAAPGGPSIGATIDLARGAVIAGFSCGPLANHIAVVPLEANGKLLRTIFTP